MENSFNRPGDRLLATFLTLLTLLAPMVSAIAQPTVCTMTFNSSDEAQVFRRNLQPLGYQFEELVPQEGVHGDWFREICASKIQCDILLVSGHFGGVFFGDKLIATLSVPELQQASCGQSCPGILTNPKAVYLMGCNTLAGKTPDDRSVSQYLEILVRDGFPRNLAEKVAAARYTDFGPSLLEQMSSFFPNSQVLAGFDSASPVGLVSGPLLAEAFANSSRADMYAIGVNPQSLQKAFAQTSMILTSPGAQFWGHSEKHEQQLRCEAVSSSPAKAKAAIAELGLQDKNFDLLLDAHSLPAVKALSQEDAAWRDRFVHTSHRLLNQIADLLGLKSDILSHLQELGVISPSQLQDELMEMISGRFENGVDYVAADQLCTIASDHYNLIFSKDFLKNSAENSAFLPFLASCFWQIDPDALQWFANTAKTAPAGALRRESLRVLAHFGGVVDPDGAPKVSACLKANEHLSAVERSGRDWGCLTGNTQTLHLSSCLQAASRNPDEKGGDDMRWFCFERLMERQDISQAECLRLSRGMHILGNEMKANWNCKNRL